MPVINDYECDEYSLDLENHIKKGLVQYQNERNPRSARVDVIGKHPVFNKLSKEFLKELLGKCPIMFLKPN